jgi:imidazolonepropionase-like amidohydrolase
MNYALLNCSMLDGTIDMSLCQNATILIKGNKIEKIIKEQQVTPPGYKVIDLAGQYLLPGLINLHAHLFGTGKPTKILSSKKLQTYIIPFLKTNLGIKVLDKLAAYNAKTALMSGTTTIRTVGDFCYTDIRTRNKINQKKLLGPRMLVSGPAITVPGGHGDDTFAKSASTPLALQKLVQTNVAQGADWIKICITGGVLDSTIQDEPGELKMTLEQTQAVCDAARSLGCPVAAHIQSPTGILVGLQGGVSTIEHGALLTEETIELCQHQAAAYILTLSPAIPLAKLPYKITKLNKLAQEHTKIIIQNAIAGAKQALANKIQVGLGTDASCPFVTHYNMWRELSYFTKYAGVTNRFALYTATLGNAQILKLDHLLGSIEAGKYADLIVVKNNPLQNLGYLTDVQKVIINGVIIDQPRVKKFTALEQKLDHILANEECEI